MASLFCNPDQTPEYDQFLCGNEAGGIVAVSIIDADEDPTLANLREQSFWTSKLNASPQRYRIITDTRGSYAGGTPTEQPGFGRNSVNRTGADHELTFRVEGILYNRNFWAAVNQTKKWNFVWVTMGNVGHYITDSSIYAKIVVEEDITSPEVWEVSVKWKDSLENAEVFEAPSAIFGE